MTQQTIVLLGPAYPYRGGNALFMSHLYEALAPHYRVHFINYTLLYPHLLFPGTTQFDQSQEMTKQIPNERLLSSVNPLSWWRTARRIRALQPNLVVFDWWNPFFGPCHWAVSALLGKEYRGNILFITENLISHEARRIDKFLTHLGLANASAFLALSAQVADDVRQFTRNGAAPIYRSELPVFGAFYAQTAQQPLSKEQAKVRLGFAPEDDIILFFGYVRKYKGLDVLLRAMPEILRGNPRTKLLIAGEFYDDPKPYYAIVQEQGIASSVKIIDTFIPNERVAEFYAASDLVILPYRSATQSGILGIAYGFERPVVVTNVGGLAESVEHEQTGFIAAPESPESLASAVQRFFELRVTVDFPANVRERAKNNSFSRIHELFREILAENSIV